MCVLLPTRYSGSIYCTVERLQQATAHQLRRTQLQQPRVQLPGRGVVLRVPAVPEAEHGEAHIAQTVLGQAPARQAPPQRPKEGSHCVRKHRPGLEPCKSHHTRYFAFSQGKPAATADFGEAQHNPRSSWRALDNKSNTNQSMVLLCMSRGRLPRGGKIRLDDNSRCGSIFSACVFCWDFLSSGHSTQQVTKND